MAQKLDGSNFESFVESSNLPIIVDFYSDGCIACRRIAPIISKAETEYCGKLNFAKVNITMNSELAEKYTVQAAPTLIIIKDGKELSRHTGAANAETINSFISSAL